MSLVCPSDDSLLATNGNLSYAVNMGWTLWHADGAHGLAECESENSWTPTTITWGPPEIGGGIDAFRKTGMMFQGTAGGDAPWDIHQTAATVTDGMSSTILVSENTYGGASPARPDLGRFHATNWASADPRAVGFVADPSMCPQPGPGCGPFRCDLADLSAKSGRDGPAWARVNQPGAIGSIGAINGGMNFRTEEGILPHPNSNHPGGITFGMADGSTRFLAETIDGTVYAKLLTPAGESLAPRYRQLPLDLQDLQRYSQ